MSYLVLARKWRPRRFAELVGQEHVVRALTNALDSGRVHHAFLFTGTRGVGKTTIARIFAKSLNCERGTSAEPCGECNACRDIDAGRFVDLLEIDAASNTGVDDVRELIDNAQYMPSRGRVKVYLIDEVHMLSKSAFNALLKTLEEPPGHVKFLLATTDPQKLPVTVLSRCLQFNLKRLDEAQITGQITRILAAEDIAAQPGAIRQLARAADGSLRDGLSLLDQAIAYTGGQLDDSAVATMLGTVDRTQVAGLLDALADGDGARVLDLVATLADYSPDWNGVLDAFADALHRVQVRQLVKDASVEEDAVPVDALAAKLRPELVQLWYQMALNGRRDLALAPSPRAGFEMTALRMLAFRPGGDAGASGGSGSGSGNREQGTGKTGPIRGPAAAREALASAPMRDATPSTPARQATTARESMPATPSMHTTAPVTPSTSAPEPERSAEPASPRSPIPVPAVAAVAAVAASSATLDATTWTDLVVQLPLGGPAKELAAHAGFVAYENGVLRLSLSSADDHLKSEGLVKRLATALAPHLGAAPQIRFEAEAASGETLHQRNTRERDARQVAAEQAFLADPDVQRLMQRHGATVVPDSIRPFDDA
ncbi:DNA polymerase III subunit gamma/tau [Lysobacter sp. A6]|uniref:DNA polymerase III subunit gamma/tau n=1 Tax=Noviluteimonas lactosilytica TaxID=2888523 RepID=A0ABS8JEN4_9GAMM|nr:DNA polymerase III subunit gamma/tau [Lysobacter lactosilyticus]MCC8362059.1 DNA polymerase III subunit gamma/tau [Lysobacter lactosilyticus]